VSNRGPVVRVLLGLGVMCVAVIVLASSIVLHGLNLLLVLIASAFAAFAAGVVRNHSRAAAVEAAVMAAAVTASAILIVTGIVVLAGGHVATLVAGLAVATGGAGWLWRARRARARTRGTAPAPGGGDPRAPAPAWLAHPQPPVSLLPTSDLGSEWLRTTSALALPVEPGARQEIIRRRQETLDELERRDPAGFARWLAAGAATDSDPATFVRGDWITGSDAA
jgi:hypothetical protein